MFFGLFEGPIDLPWWGYVLVALGFTHITIAAVTIFLHRCQAHRALDLHPAVAHFFRLWLWLTTGMVTKEWAAVHRKHHARVETAEDPHSPQIHGINRVLWGGVLLYKREADNAETLARYGHGTPDDWVERNVYAPHTFVGLIVMALLDVFLFGLVPGALIFVVQIAWIPFWAAGVINGIGHFWGYRNFACEDASTNIVPWGILIGGEELHNNHHAYATSAKLSNKWYEFDIGWLYIRILETFGLAEVKKIAPRVRLGAVKPVIDLDTVHAVITHRYDVLAKYAQSLKATYHEELEKLKSRAPQDVAPLSRIKNLLHCSDHGWTDTMRASLAEGLAKSKAVATVYSMRAELVALWGRSSATREQLVKHLEDWCYRAERSGIAPLVEFANRLRRYA